MPSLPRRVVRRARGAVAVARRGPRRRLARTLVEAGLFDRSWYELQSGRSFDEDRSAAVDYLGRGRRAGWSPHPLLEPEWVAPGRWRHGRRDPVELYLAGSSANGGPHPLFDEPAYLAGHPEAAAHPGRALGHYLQTQGPDDPLPGDGPGSRTTPAAVRERLEATVRLVAEQRLLGSRRTTTDWDTAADAAYVATWAAVELPPPPRDTADEPPLVSVVMPVRNRRQQVVAAIRSVRQQTYGGWELLVVDDGSTDGTPEVVEQQSRLEPRVRLLRGPHAGAAAARSLGLDAARGRYVAFLDSDNVWVPQFLQVALAAMTTQDLRAAHAVVEMRSATGVRYLAHQGGRDELEIVNHVDLNTFVVELALARAVGGFDPTLRRMIDWDLVLRVAAVVEPVLLPFVGVHYTEHDAGPGRTDRITLREPATWAQVVMARQLVDWAALGAAVGSRQAGRTSVVVTVRDDWAGALDLVDGALAGPDVEVVVVDRGSRVAVGRLLAARAAADAALRYIRFPIDARPALGWSLGLPGTTGSTVVLAEAGARSRPSVSPAGTAWWQPLGAALDDPSVAAAAPVVVDQDGLVDRAALGRHDPGAPPYALFQAAAPEDIAAGGLLEASALGDHALAVRAADLVEAGGADPWYETAGWGSDLSVRIAELRSGVVDGAQRLVVVPEVTLFRDRPASAPSAVDAAGLDERVGPLMAVPPRWHEAAALTRAGLEPAEWDDEGQPVLRRAPVAADAPALRWTIAIAAPLSAHGDRWGDVHFADALAASLRRLGQYVVVERRRAGSGEARSTTPYDDVLLALRGLDERAPRPGQVGLLWVISHPDLVGTEEVKAYDAVFAAGAVWARTMTERAGVPVEPLLQATDPSRFSPDLATPDTGPPVLFVGSSRGVERPIVRDAVAAGLDLAVYGTRWEGRLEPRYVRGAYLPNDRLGAAYRAAGVVLNDHWPDMAAQGFLSNRLFDAVASGARVISDPVEGIDEVFGGVVRQYATPDDLARWAGPGRAEAFPDDAGLRDAADDVRRAHSFDARAATLLAAALRLGAGRGAGG